MTKFFLSRNLVVALRFVFPIAPFIGFACGVLLLWIAVKPLSKGASDFFSVFLMVQAPMAIGIGLLMHYSFFRATGLRVKSFRTQSAERVRLLNLALNGGNAASFVVLYELVQVFARVLFGYFAFLPLCFIYVFAKR